MLRPETIVAKALASAEPEPPTHGAIIPAIQLATTYARDAEYQLRGPGYARDENPTPVHAERVIAALEGGVEALTFASGMAAATAVFRAVCKPGDRIVAPRLGYYNLRGWLERFCAQWQLELRSIDMTDLEAVRAAVPGAKIVWAETPANPTWEVTDLAAVAAIAKAAGAVFAVDATAMTPVHCRPIEHGADLVMHSATKFLGGHSDVLAGVLVTAQRDATWAALRQLRHDEGACLGPVEAYLLLRGLRTLFVRVERSSATAAALAAKLEARCLPARCRVIYPGLASHPQHALAARQMTRGFGSMFSIRVASDPLALIKKLRIWVPATSLGGVESLIEHRFTVEGHDTPTPPDLLRLSVGIEHADDLFEDLVGALA